MNRFISSILNNWRQIKECLQIRKAHYFSNIFIILFILPNIGFAQNIQTPLPKFYVAYHTTDSLIIDGKADESSWSNAQWTDDFIDIEGVKIPKFKTKMKMLWDKNYFYFYAELEEPHIWGDITQRDAVMFYNNDFEIFIDPDGDTQNYMEYEMNALNSIWDLFLTRPYRYGTTVLNNWNINGLKSAVFIDGTLNNPSDIDKKWTLEIALPWNVLTEAANSDKVPAEKTWRINFSRVNWDFELIDGIYKRKKNPVTQNYFSEYNWVWSPQGVIDMHRPEKWGAVYFSKNEVGQKDSYTLNKDELIRVKLFELHNNQIELYLNNKSWKNVPFPKSIKVENKNIVIKTEATSKSYLLSLKSPFTGKTFTINQHGKLTTN